MNQKKKKKFLIKKIKKIIIKKNKKIIPKSRYFEIYYIPLHRDS